METYKEDANATASLSLLKDKIISTLEESKKKDKRREKKERKRERQKFNL